MTNNYIQKNRDRGREIQRRLLKENPKKYYKELLVRVKKWREKYPEKYKAYQRVYVEKRAGRLKSEPCFCGENKSEAHHEDYSKPLEVIWYCKKHHRIADRKELHLLT